MSSGKKAVVLASGGLDSTTVMAIAKQGGFNIYSLSFFYGQRHSLELDAAAKVSSFIGATEHRVIEIDLKTIGGSALTDHTIEVPKSRNEADMSDGIPAT